jgi:hypothetical protein
MIRGLVIFTIFSTFSVLMAGCPPTSTGSESNGEEGCKRRHGGCLLIGCSDGLFVRYSSPIEFPYELEIVGDGHVIREVCEPDGTSRFIENSVDGGSVPLADLSCDSHLILLDYWVPTTLTFRLFVEPEVSGTLTKSDFLMFEPNGPCCYPVCYQAYLEPNTDGVGPVGIPDGGSADGGVGDGG